MFTAVVLALLALLPDPTEKWPEEARAELKRLQGRWRVEKHIVAGGESAPAEEQVLEIKGRFILAGREVGVEFVAIDPQTTPRCVDFRERDPERPDAIMEGVYKLDGDTLTFCVYTGDGKNRPVDLDGKADGHTVIVLKRVKK